MPSDLRVLKTEQSKVFKIKDPRARSLTYTYINQILLLFKSTCESNCPTTANCITVGHVVVPCQQLSY